MLNVPRREFLSDPQPSDEVLAIIALCGYKYIGHSKPHRECVVRFDGSDRSMLLPLNPFSSAALWRETMSKLVDARIASADTARLYEKQQSFGYLHLED